VPSHESKSCPRCQSTFECKVGTILECQCSDVFLSENEREYVNTRFDDCLCVNCLMEMQAEFDIVNQNKKSQPEICH